MMEEKKVVIRLTNGRTKEVSSRQEGQKWIIRGLAFGFEDSSRADFICNSAGEVRNVMSM